MRLLVTCTAGTVLGLAVVVGWLEYGARVGRWVRQIASEREDFTQGII